MNVYIQDRETLRHHEKLSWDRLKILTAIEAVILIGIFQFNATLSKFEGNLLLIVGTILTIALFLIIYRDFNIHEMILSRVKSFECFYYLTRTLNNSYPKYLKSKYLLLLIILLICILNIILIFERWNKFYGDTSSKFPQTSSYNHNTLIIEGVNLQKGDSIRIYCTTYRDKKFLKDTTIYFKYK